MAAIPLNSFIHSYIYTHTHTIILLLFWNMSGTTRVSRYKKGKTREVKTNLDLLEQAMVSGSGICWAICKPATHSRQPRQHRTTGDVYTGEKFPNLCTGIFQAAKIAKMGNFEGVLVVRVQLKRRQNFGHWELFGG